MTSHILDLTKKTWAFAKRTVLNDEWETERSFEGWLIGGRNETGFKDYLSCLTNCTMLNVAATMFPAFSKAIKTDHKLQSIIESHPTVTLWAFVVALVGLIVVTALVMLQCVYVCRHWPELRKFRWWMRIPVFMVFAILSLTLIVMVGMGFLAGLSAT